MLHNTDTANAMLRSGKNREGKNSNMADVRFSKPKMVILQTWIVISTTFGLLIDINPPKRVMSPNPKLKVKFRRTSWHLENRYNVITPPKMVPLENLAADA